MTLMPANAAENRRGATSVEMTQPSKPDRVGESFVQGKMSRVSGDRMPDAAKDWLDDLVHHGPTSNGKPLPFFRLNNLYGLGLLGPTRHRPVQAYSIEARNFDNYSRGIGKTN